MCACLELSSFVIITACANINKHRGDAETKEIDVCLSNYRFTSAKLKLSSIERCTMNSVMVKQEAKAEQSKSKTKLKIPKFFNSIVAKMSPAKLAVDAVPVKKNGLTVAVENDDIEENRINSIDPWQSVSSDEFENPSSAAENLPANNRQLAAPSSLLISPNPNHLASYGLLHTTNNSMAVSNVGVQNNYNFSQINGLHIGNVNVHQTKAATNGISNGGNSGSEQGAEASTSTQKIPKTKSISGK